MNCKRYFNGHKPSKQDKNVAKSADLWQIITKYMLATPQKQDNSAVKSDIIGYLCELFMQLVHNMPNQIVEDHKIIDMTQIGLILDVANDM